MNISISTHKSVLDFEMIICVFNTEKGIGVSDLERIVGVQSTQRSISICNTQMIVNISKTERNVRDSSRERLLMFPAHKGYHNMLYAFPTLGAG
jgi:hypothetical protein